MSSGGISILVRWLRSALDSRLARDSLLVFSLSGLGRLIALGKEMLVAALFGVNGPLVPSFLANMLGSSFFSTLVPAAGRLRAEQGEQAVQGAVASSLTVLAALLLPLTHASRAARAAATGAELPMLSLVILLVVGALAFAFAIKSVAGARD